MRNIIRRVLFQLQKLRVIYYKFLSSDVELVGKPIRNQPLLFTGQGKVIFHGNVRIGYFPSPGYFNTYAHFDLRGQNASIEIDEGVILNNNAALIADNANIFIGRKCLIGPNVTVYTSDFHSLDPEKRLSEEGPMLDVIIQENVFIGTNVTILKGVTVGKNSVIGVGSVVIENVPENVIAAGVPCKVIKSL
ncbi:acyltransferase [Planctomycetota bacterium]